MVQLTCLLIKNYGKKKTFPFLALKIKKKPIIQFSPHHKTHLHIYIYIYIYILHNSSGFVTCIFYSIRSYRIYLNTALEVMFWLVQWTWSF